MRSPRRTARTASALMIGVALISAAALFTSSFRDTFGRHPRSGGHRRLHRARPVVPRPARQVAREHRRPRRHRGGVAVAHRCWPRSRTTRSASAAIDPTGVPRPRQPRRHRRRLRRPHRRRRRDGVPRQRRGSRCRGRRHGRRHVLERRRAPAHGCRDLRRQLARQRLVHLDRPARAGQRPDPARPVRAGADRRRCRPRPGAAGHRRCGRRVPAGRGADQRRVPRRTRKTRSTSCWS